MTVPLAKTGSRAALLGIDRRLPASKAWSYSEHVLQRLVVRELTLLRGTWPELVRLMAIPNGGHRGKAAAGKIRAEGAKPGVPDLFLPVARRGQHGLWIELKKAGGSPSPEQLDWLLYLHHAGYAAHICNDPATVRQIVTAYLTE